MASFSKKVLFSVQEIDNSGVVIDSDVADNLTHGDAIALAYHLRRINTKKGNDASWFAVVPYEQEAR